jgi:nudix-type nucleoside diphosphatase (YffH/AdpP family)
MNIENRIKVREIKTLSDDWSTLKKTTFDYQRNDGRWQTVSRETYDRGNGAAILLFNRVTNNILLVRQFRYPAYVNGLTSGMLIEVCAGLLDKEDPETAIRREAEEELGVQIGDVHKVFEAYMSPGSVTEKLHFYIAEYDIQSRIHAGGGEINDGEDIEVLEIPLSKALEMIKNREIQDAKTIMLLQECALTWIVRES